jgi:peptidoglycan/xylan/chitin deacetylase (PgdA/CDA1 family)
VLKSYFAAMKNILILLLVLNASLPGSISTNKIKKEQFQIKSLHHIPVLCYHNIYKSPLKENLLYISEKDFKEQMKGLFDSGYQTVLPDQLVAHYQKRSALPPKSILISFDDAHESHYSFVEPVLQQYGFKAVFFVNTISINYKGFLSSDQIKKLSLKGHVIGAHTYNHPNLKKNKQVNWNKQLNIPKKMLENITGKTIDCFAYPYGEYNKNALNEVKKSGYKTAFQLTGPVESGNELLTIRRMMVNGHWSSSKLMKQMSAVFR